jgi:hypothetical protein
MNPKIAVSDAIWQHVVLPVAAKFEMWFTALNIIPTDFPWLGS